MNRIPLAAAAAALALAGCSSHSTKSGNAEHLYDVTPAAKADACSAVPASTVKDVYGAEVVGTAARSLPEYASATGCVINVKGQAFTALSVFLFHGKDWAAQYAGYLKLNGDTSGTDSDGNPTKGLPALSVGVSGFGGASGHLTVVDVQERNFGVRLLCDASPAKPSTPIGTEACLKVLDGLAGHLS